MFKLEEYSTDEEHRSGIGIPRADERTEALVRRVIAEGEAYEQVGCRSGGGGAGCSVDTIRGGRLENVQVVDWDVYSSGNIQVCFERPNGGMSAVYIEDPDLLEELRERFGSTEERWGFQEGESVALFEGPNAATGAPLGSGIAAAVDDDSVLLDHANLGSKLVERDRIGAVLREGELNEAAV
jgi:hypothetical protein